MMIINHGKLYHKKDQTKMMTNKFLLVKNKKKKITINQRKKVYTNDNIIQNNIMHT
jgi:hypothetical protein